jgi:hypothetical protein
MQAEKSVDVSELHIGDHVRRTDTGRDGAVVKLHTTCHMAFVQYRSNTGEGAWVPTTLLTRILNEGREEHAL